MLPTVPCPHCTLPPLYLVPSVPCPLCTLPPLYLAPSVPCPLCTLPPLYLAPCTVQMVCQQTLLRGNRATESSECGYHPIPDLIMEEVDYTFISVTGKEYLHSCYRIVATPLLKCDNPVTRQHVTIVLWSKSILAQKFQSAMLSSCKVRIPRVRSGYLV